MRNMGCMTAMFLSTALVYAGDETAAKKKSIEKSKAIHDKMILEQYDTDKDGKISEEEKNVARGEFEKRQAEKTKKKEAVKTKVLEKYDIDKDGKISDQEMAAMKADMAKKCVELKARKEAMIKKYDKDKDGKLNEEEKITADAEMKAIQKEMDACGPM